MIVNPNNPDGRLHRPEDLLALRPKVGLLVVDESFGDVTPALSLLPHAGGPGLLVLRSFGKFWGLAGLRLGFALGGGGEIHALSQMAGPWPVTGPAIDIGMAALADQAWADKMRAQLACDAARADGLASGTGNADLLPLLRRVVDDFVLVPEDGLLDAHGSDPGARRPPHRVGLHARAAGRGRLGGRAGPPRRADRGAGERAARADRAAVATSAPALRSRARR